ncbi:MAG: flagellar motor switch protein FliG [Limnochordia bacterium]
MSVSQPLVPSAGALPGRLSGKQKAAVLLVSLGPDLAAAVFRHLSESEIEVLTQTISVMPPVAPDTRDSVLKEFHSMLAGNAFSDPAGPEYAMTLLQRSLGSDKAATIMDRVAERVKEPPLNVARRAEPAQLAEFIRNEHPQTIAVILAHLRPSQAGAVLSSLPPERQVEVAGRLATLDRTTPELLKEIENVLHRHLAPMGTQEMQVAGGVEVVVDVLNRVDRATEKTILDGLRMQYPDLAEEIKKHMLVFEDIVRLDPRSMQRVIRDVDAAEWALALKVASDEVVNHVFANMSKRLADLVREEIGYLGLVRLREVEEAQQRIVGLIRRLEEAGEVIVARSEEDEVFV